MASQTVQLNCPGCGAPVSIGQKICEWCKNPVTVSTFNSVYHMPLPQVSKYANSYKQALAQDPHNPELNASAAMCFLKLKLYTQALDAFEKAIVDNFDNSETYFYAAVCLLEGKKAFLHQRPTINKIIDYIQAAIQIEPRGIYYYFLAYIKYDYFKRKFLNISPDYIQTLATAAELEYSEFDATQLFELLGVERPAGF